MYNTAASPRILLLRTTRKDQQLMPQVLAEHRERPLLARSPKRATLFGIGSRSPRKVLLALLIAVVGALVATSPAQAHDGVTSSDPAEGSTITELTAVTVTFSDELLKLGEESRAYGISVADTAGAFYQTSCATLDGNAISTDVALGQGGTYTVTWQVVSADGHPTSDSFKFNYAPAEGVPSPRGSATPPACASVISPSETETTVPALGWIVAAAVFILLAAAGLVVVLRLGRKQRPEKDDDSTSMAWLNAKHGHDESKPSGE